MLRAIIFALVGQLYFLGSLPMMIPLRIKPIENYNLFYMPFLAVLFFFLFYRTCTVVKQSKAYGYGFFAGMVLWQLIGEVASVPVPKGYITQYANLDLKMLGGYFFVIVAWLMLKVLWRTQTIKNSVAVCLLTFLSIWSFEVYMHNYSSMVPMEMMPKIANVVLVLSILLSVIILVIAKKAVTAEKKTVMGVLLYITISLVMMSAGQWRKPMNFYMTHEAEHIRHQIKDLKAELAYIEQLKQKTGIQNGDLKHHEEENGE